MNKILALVAMILMAGPAKAAQNLLSPEDRTVDNLTMVNHSQLEALYQQGENLDCLPTGPAVGAARGILNVDQKLLGRVLEWLTGPAWHQFEFAVSPSDCRTGHGFVKMFGEQAVYFSARILDDGKTIELDYNQDQNNFVSSELVRQVGLREQMVRITGRYGPIYIGRATYGKYEDLKQYKTSGFLAWFFLDFNSGALAERSCRDQGKYYDYRQKTCY